MACASRRTCGAAGPVRSAPEFANGLAMTADEFRDLALQLPGALEDSHMGHPDFRIDNRIFATLGLRSRTETTKGR